ncbi:hypothetical protein FISHEDRAFT_68866 [Fistulina hepatica ATCC 64428]|uniref:Fungal-type protein kinase domain-containing protein n=1 Tax=Fistulina hepatica ATCC 64428 TaxID=1128425 RepID=A0A0D7ANS5_9AGAR|nr:hypothetical protein FISHEDRAFT_68866 [Fistulina hepatica ATCC 64428]
MDIPHSLRTLSSPLASTSLQQSQENATKDMAHEIVKLPLDEVFSKYLPLVPSANVDELHLHLKECCVIVNDWWSYFQKDPKDRQEKEDIVFKDLETIFQDIVKTKKSACCSSNHSCDNTVTIENMQMRLWYHLRSHSAVSEPFNFVKDTKSFIHFVLAFAFASLAALGYDPTVKRCCDQSGKLFYVFEIVQDEAHHYFRTIHVLSEYCAVHIPGRGTCVFAVQRCSSFDDTEPFGDEAVLKDFWLEEWVSSEWTIQTYIFNHLEGLKKLMSYPEWLSSIMNHKELLSLITTGDYKKYVMTISHHGEVRLGNVPQHSFPPPIKTCSLALLSITNDLESSWT